MVLYRLKLREFEVNVEVPKDVTGLHNVADYICRNQARKYGKAVTSRKGLLSYRKRRLGNEDNWYDSHLDVITELLLDLREKLRDKHG